MNIKEKMLKQLADAKAEETALRAAVVDGDTKEARQAAAEALDQVKAKIAEINDIIAELDKPADETPAEGEGERKINKITETRGANKPMELEMQKRLAFANFVTRGTSIPTELRASSATTDVASAIPENLVNKIIEVLENHGNVLALVNKTSFAVGQTIPVDGTKPTASWVNEGAGSTAIKKTTSSIVFGAFKLRCEINYSQEVSVQTISAFEATFVKQVGEAMTKAIEGKIVSADDGDDCPTGILYRASGTDSTVNINKQATGHFDFKALCDAEALLPTAYEGGAKWCMSKKTFMTIYSMTDSNGQPIGRINYGIGGKPERTLLGRDVVISSDMADYTEASAAADVCVAFLFDFSDYTLNTSYDLGIQRKQDWDTEDHKVKAVMSVDGKVTDRHSLVKVVKKYN